MALEDGRFLVGPQRYASLINTLSEGDQSMKINRLEQVHPKFFVIAIGQPVPPYQGFTLDPPFRSRFQSKFIRVDASDDHYHTLLKLFPSISPQDIHDIFNIATIASRQESEFKIPEFSGSMYLACKFLALGLRFTDVFSMMYPYPWLSTTDYQSKKSMEAIFKKLGHFLNEQEETTSDDFLEKFFHSIPKRDAFLVTRSRTALSLLKAMICKTSKSSFYLVGDKSGGKSAFVKEYIRLSQSKSISFPVYRDLSSRDLLQRRATNETGDTIWVDSPLLEGMKEGLTVVVDGVESLNPGCLATLSRIVSNRSCNLPDGSILVSKCHFSKLGDASKSKVSVIHDDFLLIASGRTLITGSEKSWITPETVSLMPSIVLDPPTDSDVRSIIQINAPSLHSTFQEKLVLVFKSLQTEQNSHSEFRSSLTLRQIIKIASHLVNYPNDSLYDLLMQASMVVFAPIFIKEQFNAMLENCGILTELDKKETQISVQISDGTLTVDGISVQIKRNPDWTLVPQTLFYNNQRQLSVLKNILKSWNLNEHLLLIGNQGVGKNKIVDHLLFLLQRERQYIQLHRDTTVQSLTSTPYIENGAVRHEDSPLVIASRRGHVLIIDEADKAPAHVIATLKTFIEDGEILLGDGRRICQNKTRESDVELHRDFRLIVLANRPGFPFLGNDFFRELGDLFSCHAIDNPDSASEVDLLRNYAPSVSEGALIKLSQAFGELRKKASDGDISYPYSTREIVNIVKYVCLCETLHIAACGLLFRFNCDSNFDRFLKLVVTLCTDISPGTQMMD
jgi:MoxR-like ATPase